MTTENTSVENTNLKPFQAGEDRTVELAQKGGSQSTKKKQIAAKIRELKKKYPFCQKDINNFISILTNLGLFFEASETELIELVILKNEALEKAVTYEEKYKIQKDYINLLLEVAIMFHGKEQILAYQQAIQKREKEGVEKIPVLKRMKLAGAYKDLGLAVPSELEIDICEVKEEFDKAREKMMKESGQQFTKQR